jgi:hypothetical protein
MKVEEFLKSSRVAPFLAVLEPVSGEATLVKLTPVTPSGCACSRSIVIALDQIDDVEPTARTLACCGKLHVVARVRLHQEARVSAHDVVVSLMTASSRLYEDGGGPFGEGGDPVDETRLCIEEARSHYKNMVRGCRVYPAGSEKRAKCVAKCQEDLRLDMEACP